MLSPCSQGPVGYRVAEQHWLLLLLRQIAYKQVLKNLVPEHLSNVYNVTMHRRS